MKNSFLRTILLILVTVVVTVFVYRWIDRPISITAEHEAPGRTDTIGVGSDSNWVSLKTARSHIEEYVLWWNCVPDHVTINDSLIRLKTPKLGTLAYTIHQDDIIESLIKKEYVEEVKTFFKYQKMRAYMGIDETSAHLYIVAVDDEGNDIIPTDSHGHEFVYDLTTPCPNSCDTNSPLYRDIDNP